MPDGMIPYQEPVSAYGLGQEPPKPKNDFDFLLDALPYIAIGFAVAVALDEALSEKGEDPLLRKIGRRLGVSKSRRRFASNKGPEPEAEEE